MSPKDVLATIYRHVGIACRASLVDFFGCRMHQLL
jgi:hypothetical protein